MRLCPGGVHSPPASPNPLVPQPHSLLLLVLTGSLEASVQLVNVDLVQALLLRDCSKAKGMWVTGSGDTRTSGADTECSGGKMQVQPNPARSSH